MIAMLGSRPKVIGRRMASAMVELTPGRAPMTIPAATAKTATSNISGCSKKTAKDCRNTSVIIHRSSRQRHTKQGDKNKMNARDDDPGGNQRKCQTAP